MNRMLSLISAFRRVAFGLSFLLVFLLAGAHAQRAAQAPCSPQVQALDNARAAKLLIHLEKPHYPSIAKVNFIRGTVKLEIRVTTNGRVSEAHVIAGQPILAAAALKSVRKWVYQPYVSREGPTPFTTHVAVNFNLHPHSPRGILPGNTDEFLEKQVRPPEIVSHPRQDQSVVGIRMKVLVDSHGKVMDATASEVAEPKVVLARKSLRCWKFRPAQWGAIAVPWYITVTVPLPYTALDQTANSAKH